MSFYVGDPTGGQQPKGQFVPAHQAAQFAQPTAHVATFNPTVGAKPVQVPGHAGAFQLQPQFHQIQGHPGQPQLIAAQPGQPGRPVQMQPVQMQPTMLQYRPTQVMAIRPPQMQQQAIRLQPQVQQVQMHQMAHHQPQTVQYVQPVSANAYHQHVMAAHAHAAHPAAAQPVFAPQATLVAAQQPQMAARQPQLRMAPRVAMPVQHVQVRPPMGAMPSHNYRGQQQHGGGGGGQHHHHNHHNHHQGPKPIKATEVKSYLYAWCTQKKLKPEYNYETIGKSPKIRYKCTLTIPGLDHTAAEEARSKRDAQTAAAWNYCDEMVKANLMKRKDLPPRLQQPENLEKASSETDKEGDTTGGWTIDNARQRLNRFCMAERISCDFENAVVTTQLGGGGPGTAQLANKLTTSKLVLSFKRAQEPIVIETKSSNKKQANANCAVLAVRELFRRGFIEQFGKISQPGGDQNDEDTVDTESNQSGNQAAQPVVAAVATPGQKRKAELEPLDFDENGNWTLETARAKLQDFFAINGKDLVFDEKESGTLQDRQYLFSCAIDVKDQHIEASATAPNKKSAQKKCALEMVVKLYKLKMIEGNLGKRIKPRHGPGLIKRTRYNEGTVVHGGPKVMPSVRLYNSSWEMERITPYADRHIKAKLEQVDLPKEVKLFYGHAYEALEDALKKYCEKLTDGGKEAQKKPHPDPVKTGTGLHISEVSRIGPNPKATMLAQDRTLQLAIVFVERPTNESMHEVYRALNESLVVTPQKSEKVQLTLLDMQFERALIRLTAEPKTTSNTTDWGGIDIELLFTSPLSPTKADPELAENLPQISTTENLIQLRQSRFFQQNAGSTFNCIAVAKVLKSIVASDPAWCGLVDWHCEVLAYAAMASYEQPMTAGDGLKRVLSVIASGLIQRGMADPTDQTKDVFACLTRQQKEEITFKAQHSLRLLAFQKIHLVLRIDELPDPPQLMTATAPTPPPPAMSNLDSKAIKEETNESFVDE